jgi:ribose transport system substrate-binding protein
MVRDAIDMGLSVLKGEKVDPVKIIPTTIVDRSNYKDYLDANSPY